MHVQIFDLMFLGIKTCDLNMAVLLYPFTSYSCVFLLSAQELIRTIKNNKYYSLIKYITIIDELNLIN